MLEILVGPIASGKSTYAKQQAEKGALIVNDDSIITAIHGNYKFYDKSLKIVYKAIENTIIQYGLFLDRKVIIDRPNYSKVSRMRYIGLAKSLDKQVRCIVFEDLGLEIHAKRRYLTDNRGYSLETWKETYKRIARNYDEPDMLEENLDDILFV